MRSMFVVVALVGCAPRATTEPAWPRPHVADRDGGESLAPHQPRQVTTAAIQHVDDAKPIAAKPAAQAVTTATVDVTPPTVIAPVVQPVEEPIMTEDIIIEIDD